MIAAERVRSIAKQSLDAPPASAGGEVDDCFTEDGPAPSTDVLVEWTAALGDVEDADEAVRHDLRGEVPASMAFGISVPPLPEHLRPHPFNKVPRFRLRGSVAVAQLPRRQVSFAPHSW